MTLREAAPPSGGPDASLQHHLAATVRNNMDKWSRETEVEVELWLHLAEDVLGQLSAALTHTVLELV